MTLRCLGLCFVDLVKVGVFALIEIPFMIFALVVELSLILPLFIENFYVMNTGTYLMTGSPWLGFLVNTVLFGAIFLAMRLFFVFLACRDLKKEMI